MKHGRYLHPVGHVKQVFIGSKKKTRQRLRSIPLLPAAALLARIQELRGAGKKIRGAA
jgi:hypothetical protein